ncbi:MAG: hypothetical protein L6Q97_25875, partial [Thermoanaerobaculia bacterium]|nr:hypothetical protein [Thermoanaerobaculia bacterium]
MKKILILFIWLSFGPNGQCQVFDNLDWQIGFQPYFSPISIGYGSEGWSFELEKDIKTPFGHVTFEVSSNSKRFEEKKESEKILIKEVEVNKPIHIEVPKYIHVPGPTKTIVKIKEVEKKVEVRSYIVEINNFNGKNSQEFFISGIESLQIDVSGDTKIEASEGRIAIDFSKSSVKKIRFKGILVSEEDNLKNNLNSALIKFNETTGQIYHYDNKSCMAYLFVGGEYRNTHADGLIIVSDFEGKIGKFSSSQHYKDDFEYLQKIRS